MADLAPIPYDPFGNAQKSVGLIHGILGVQQQQTELQKQKQLMRERIGIQKMMQSGVDDQGNSIRNENGEPDPSKLLPALGRIAPLSGQDYAQNILKTHADKIGLQSASASLDAQERNMLSGLAGAAMNNPDATAASFGADLDQLVKQHPEMAPAAEHMKSLVAHIDNAQDPAQRAHMWGSLQALMQHPQPIGTAPEPASIDTGAEIRQGTISPQTGAFTQAQPGIQRQLPPGLVTVHDAAGNVWYANQQDLRRAVAPGQGEGLPGGGGGMMEVPAQQEQQPAGGGPNATPTAPAPRPQMMMPDQAAVQNEIADVRAATGVNQLGKARDINRRILSLLNQGSVGGLNLLNRAAAIAGLPQGSTYQELGAFLDNQAAAAAASMGLPHTNAGLETAKQFTGNTEYNNKVIKDKTLFWDAMNEASAAYRQGMERVLGTAGPGGAMQPNYAAYQKYRADWAKNFDPEVFSFERAYQTGDKEEMARIKKDLGKKGMTELADKRDALLQLVSGQKQQ